MTHRSTLARSRRLRPNSARVLQAEREVLKCDCSRSLSGVAVSMGIAATLGVSLHFLDTSVVLPRQSHAATSTQQNSFK